MVYIPVIMAMSACSDGNDIDTAAPAFADRTAYMWDTACNSYTVEIRASGDWRIESEAGWLYIPESEREGTGNAVVTIYVEQNPYEEERHTELRLYGSGGDAPSQTAGVTQAGTADCIDNALKTDDLTRNYAVGWGYNAFGEYASTNDIRQQVINYRKLADEELRLGEDIAQDFIQYELNYTKSTARSLNEFSKTITKESNSKTDILLYTEEVKKRTVKTTTTKEERSYATLSVLNIVAQRNISRGTLKALLGNNADILTQAFRDDINSVKTGAMPVSRFIDRYGTDVVLTAYLGGRLDYTVSIKKTTTTDVERTVTATYKQLFGIKSSMTKEEEAFAESVKLDYDCNCHVRGGDRDGLDDEINAKISKKEPIDDSKFTKWENSFKDAEKLLRSGTADLIDTRTIPVYDLIADSDVHRLVKEAITHEAADNIKELYAEPVPAYKIAIPDNVSGVMLASDPSSGKIVAEICREFIPQIRTDEAVTVVYPVMSNGLPDHRRGLFVGDGKVKRPGRVMWSGGKVSYVTDESMKGNSRLGEVFVLNGDTHARREDYMDEPRTTGIIESSSLKSICKVTVFYYENNKPMTTKGVSVSYVKLGDRYWAYCGEVSLPLDIEKQSYVYKKQGKFAFPKPSDLNSLRAFLLNDLSLVFQKRAGLNVIEGRSAFPFGDEHKNPNRGFPYYYGLSIKKTGATVEHKKKCDERLALLLVRNEPINYAEAK